MYARLTALQERGRKFLKTSFSFQPSVSQCKTHITTLHNQFQNVCFYKSKWDETPKSFFQNYVSIVLLSVDLTNY